MGIETPTVSPTGDRRSWAPRRSSRYAAAALALAGLSTVAVSTAAQASPTRATKAHIASVQTAPYRHGIVPMRGRAWAPQLVTCTQAKCVAYGGGISGVGVTTGKEQVYLVFWGTQWGTAGTNSNGYTTFSNDKSSMAVLLQEFYKGLGTGGELWSGVATQYCQGVATGAKRCPTSAAHVAYPTGGALAGVWEDTGGASPAQSTGHQLAVEAEKAATHFGNTTTASNRNVQYVVISPTGTNPDNYINNGFCAWHDYTGDSTLDGGGGASGPLTAFTNLPYITDAGQNCGAGIVDGKATDGITIVEGHEYAETITDQFPAGGWVASNGMEVGDSCAWVTTGGGRMQDITLTTGTFAVQGVWSNLANKGKGGCAIKHSIVT